MKNKELIGYIGIDSGQVLIVDPCYLSNWKDDEYDDTRGIRKGNKTCLYLFINLFYLSACLLHLDIDS